MENLGPAFGFFPQMKPRRQGLPSDSANLPIDVLRGRLAGLLGAPADIANLLRSPSPTEMFGEVNYEAPAQFPYTTEKFLKDLPLAPTSRVGQAAGQAASFVPLNPMPAVRGVQKVGQVVGEELAATMMGQRPNTMMSKVVPQPLFAVAPEQGLLSVKTEPIKSLLQVKPQAPVSDIGFYSATEQAALNLGRNKGTGQSFINDLMKAPDVKKEELQFTGLEDFLRDKPNVTKQEVQDFLANNRVDVQEVTLGAQPTQDPIGIAKRKEIFDKYEPQIQALDNEISQYNKSLDEQIMVARDKFADTHARLNTRGYMPTGQDYEAYNLADAELQRIRLLPRYRNEFRDKQNALLDARDAEANAAYVVPESTPTKYDKYQLAGGENYREILLTLPPKNVTEQTWQVLKADGTTTTGYFTSEEAARRDAGYIGGSIRQSEPVTYQSGYRSSHFNEPNILAHMRVNDRIDADGKKMLLVEEIQSDWHQAGRERGYKKEGDKQALEAESKAISNERNKLVKELSEQEKQNGFVSIEGQQQWDAFKEKENLFKQKSKDFSSQAPDAPFKDTWYQLALKRLTKYAAENGYERIGLTTGKRQIERFADELRQNVDEIAFSSGYPSKDITTISASQNGQLAFTGTVKDGKFLDGQARGKTVEEVLGKSMAKQIAEKESGVLKGDDLTIGGEGMKKYYDEIYPKFLDKYGKKYGASVGETQITTDYARDASGIPAQRPSKETIRYLDITPQMKEGTSKGQPLFAATPAIPAASLLDEEKRKEITSLLE
jgi:hypothetical protein